MNTFSIMVSTANGCGILTGGADGGGADGGRAGCRQQCVRSVRRCLGVSLPQLLVSFRRLLCPALTLLTPLAARGRRLVRVSHRRRCRLRHRLYTTGTGDGGGADGGADDSCAGSAVDDGVKRCRQAMRHAMAACDGFCGRGGYGGGGCGGTQPGMAASDGSKRWRHARRHMIAASHEQAMAASEAPHDRGKPWRQVKAGSRAHQMAASMRGGK